ncbi:MAG: molybdopterin molybdotransferase MoeA [Gemmatales bacterium]|nr:molybdopterin molybdotransferase MoeA [Gemmatales bacterium]MDW8385392.1 molybdopterin molybdotransferase MoeA [Gemmatales bacterium]
MKGFRDRAEVSAVLALIERRITSLPGERVPLSQAGGRVLASDIHSEVDVPSFDRAAMDGYAVRGEDTFGASLYSPIELRLIGEVRAGRQFAGHCGPGQAIRIMTGAPMPGGADAVLPAEQAEEQNGVVLVREPVPPGRHVGRRGEDVQSGCCILAAGRVLRPQDLGVLAAVGVAEVDVVRRPVAAIYVTGDELLPCGSKPDGFRIVDSNSIMLEALVRRDGGVPILSPILPDQRDALTEALASCSADVILVTGGTSVGSEDHLPSVMAEIGELAVHGVAMRPASPSGLGFVHGNPVFLLPGNPVSCLAAYEFFAGPAIRRQGGKAMDWPHRRVVRPLASKIASAIGRVDYVRVQFVEGAVVPLAISGASILTTTTRADGFVIVPADCEGYPPGASVEVFLYDA